MYKNTFFKVLLIVKKYVSLLKTFNSSLFIILKDPIAMNAKITPPPTPRLNNFFKVCFFSILLISIFQTGCRKDDLFRNKENGNPAGIREFFSKNVNVNPQVQRVMDELQKQNTFSGNSFVKSITGKHGYARWDKAFTQLRKSKLATSFSKITGDGSDTVVIVPLVKDGDVQVEAYLEAHLKEDVKINLRTAGEYRRMKFGNGEKSAGDANGAIGDAENAALRYLLLTRDVFGVKKFEFTDKKIFKGLREKDDTSGRIRVKFKDAATSLQFVEECVTALVPHTVCKRIRGCDTDLDLDNPANYECWETWTEISVCWTVLYDGGGEGGPGTGSGGTGPGGTGDPCSGNGLITNGILPPGPCDPGGGSGWIPDLPTVPSDQDIKNIIQNKPFALYEDIPCSLIKQWLSIATFIPSNSIIQKLNSVYTISIIPLPGQPALTTVDIARVQDINNAYSSIVNMDYFSVKVNTLPKVNGVQLTADQLMHYIRVNIDSFINTDKANFTPYKYGNTDDEALWNSSSPTGAMLSIAIPGDYGSVITSFSTNNKWTFTTVHDHLNGNHPVSGNRDFGYVTNTDGTYTFYTKGVDRLTTWYTDLAQKQPIEMLKPLYNADLLWQSFQTGIFNFLDDHEGNSTIQVPVTLRPDWQHVKDVIDGIRPLNTLSKDCP